jgi:molybdate transport system substrate-binding protein
LISVAQEEGDLNDLRANLGNDIAIKAYREGKSPFPGGTIIARLGWGFAQFDDGKRAAEAVHNTCFFLPRDRQSSRLGLQPLRTLISEATCIRSGGRPLGRGRIGLGFGDASARASKPTGRRHRSRGQRCVSRAPGIPSDDQRCHSGMAMFQYSLAKGIAPAAAGALLACWLTVTAGSAAEIKVLTSVAVSSALNQITPNFEQETGNKLDIGYSLIADIRKRLLEGETADVIILSRPVMDELDKQKKFASDSITNIAGTPVALAVRAGAPKPDISTVDALKSTLLGTKSIVYADPSKGGASGVYFAHVVDRLGIADQLRSKTILVPGAQAAELVAKGEAEIGVAQTSEIVPVTGAQVLGPLPGEYASTTLFAAGIGATTTVPEAAKSLVKFLTGPIAGSVFSAKGFQPEQAHN